ncbi:Fibrous sheath-interacting protein 2 [Plecturocebus cupreus]
MSVHFKSARGEYFISPKEKPLKASLAYSSENLSDITEDMVHMIAEKLTALAFSKQNELAHLEFTQEPAYQQHMKDPIAACQYHDSVTSETNENNIQKSRCSRMSSPFGTEKENKLSGIRVVHGSLDMSNVSMGPSTC